MHVLYGDINPYTINFYLYISIIVVTIKNYKKDYEESVTLADLDCNLT